MTFEEANNEKLATYCRALGTLSRVKIIQQVAEMDSCVTEDLKGIGTSISNIGQHLKGLKNDGLIKGRLARSKACYCINMENLEEFKNLVNALYNKAKEHEKIICNREDGIS